MKTESVHLLWHTYQLEDDLAVRSEVKLIGVFSSQEKAKNAIEQLKDKEGFCVHPVSCFEISENKVDRIAWNDGFFTARWTE